MKKRYLVAVVIFIFMANSAFCQSKFKKRSQPNGFRGIEWGEDLFKFSDMEFKDEILRIGIKIYIRKNDIMLFQGIEVKEINYNFWEEQFLGVDIVAYGQENFKKFKKSLFAKYGKAKLESMGYMKGYSWQGEKTRIMLNVFIGDAVIVSMTSIEMEKFLEAVDLDKIKGREIESFY